MTSIQKRFLAIILVIAVIDFGLFILPNMVASQNTEMVLAFEPDEAVVLPYIFHMIAPTENLNQSLRNFIFYEYYYYGFPYFAISAIVILPLQWLGQLGNIPLVMLILRQLVSVLPLLAGLILLVFLQDGFRTYRSPLLFIFLLSVPAVIQNNFWFHPDGITFLLVVLTIFFLNKDNLNFGWNFLIAAILCGLATAVKTIGAGFFLAVGLTLILGIIQKKVTKKRLVGISLAFIIIMGLTFIIANPFLLSHWARTAFLYIVHKQSVVLSQGYGVVYVKGLMAAWPSVRQSFGEFFFILTAIGVALWGAFRGPRRLLHGLILAWFVPISVFFFYFVHYKFQYWLPAALPLFSSLVLLFPEKLEMSAIRSRSQIIRIVLLLIVSVQFALFIISDIQGFSKQIHRADNNPNIIFYDKVVDALAPLPDIHLRIYNDYRLYVPKTPNWGTRTSFDLLDYSYIQDGKFDALLLMEQRIQDYLNPNMSGIDPENFSLNQQFYRDANNGTITGYHLIYRDDYGLVFVRDDLYQKFFQ
jgi:hypothetical protein